MIDLTDMIDWALKALAMGIVGYGVKEIGRLRDSVERLNDRVATVIERTDHHGRQIEKHDERLRELEIKKNGG